MIGFEVYGFKQSSVAYLYGLRSSIQLDPVYQRQGEVWTRDKQQLLIDSIINGFDVPKIYLHAHDSWIEENGNRYKYSLVDGRQRLEAIWEFLNGSFALADDFVLLESGSTAPAGLNYSELEKQAPELANAFSATTLDVQLIRTDDVELIEEMFSRLNEAVPLNAAEKRNGRGGPLRDAVKNVAATTFFADRLPFTNRRYRHLDLATKFLLWADSSGPTDTKKRRLDDFWEQIKDTKDVKRAKAAEAAVLPTLEEMSGTFLNSDKLLSNIGMVSVYFLLFRELTLAKKTAPLRSAFEEFEKVRRLNRPLNEEVLSVAQRRLLEFDRLAQSPNDEGALLTRLETLKDYLSDPSQFVA